MKQISALLLALSFVAPASAESCVASREYILDGLAGDLPAPAGRYQDTFKACMAALVMPNVRDAYVLKDGGIAIVPTTNSVAATAETLAEFCHEFPNDVAKIMTPREQHFATSVGVAVMLSSRAVTSCREIVGRS